MYLLFRPGNVPNVMWKSARPLRIVTWLFAVVPLVFFALAAGRDVYHLSRSGVVPGRTGRFVCIVRGGRGPMFLPTWTTVAGVGFGVATLCGTIGWYAALKRSIYHRVWKAGFAVCLHCGERLAHASGRQRCPACGTPMPKELHRAWKDWYESTWDETVADGDRPDLETGPITRTGFWW